VLVDVGAGGDAGLIRASPTAISVVQANVTVHKSTQLRLPLSALTSGNAYLLSFDQLGFGDIQQS
jgi:hypothetical protein